MNKYKIEENFQILQVLGKGAFSTVYKVVRFADKETYALKRVPFKNLKVKEIQNALNEIRILASVKHPNIVGYRESFIDVTTEDLCVVMNYAGGGDFSVKIKECRDKKIRLPENLVIKFFYQLTSALYELHIRNVIHRDLKTANIFLSDDWKNVILGDMNVSKIVKNVFAYTQTGTPYYASPEVWRDEPYSIKTDVWSLGCVIYEMCMLKPPFNATDMDGLFEKVQKCDFDLFDNFYSKSLRDSILKLMAPNSENRPTCEKILNFSIFNNLKVLLGENSLSQILPESFNYYPTQLLETIKPGRDFRDLDILLPPPQYSFDLNDNNEFLHKFGNDNTRQKKVTANVSKGDGTKQQKEEDCFLRKKNYSKETESKQKKKDKSSEDLKAEKRNLVEDRIMCKNSKVKEETILTEVNLDKTKRELEENKKNNSHLDFAKPKKNQPKKIIVNIQNDLKTAKTEIVVDNNENLRVKKTKTDLLTLNTINSQSQDKNIPTSKPLFEIHAKSILRNQLKQHEVQNIEALKIKNDQNMAQLGVVKQRKKTDGIRSSNNLKIETESQNQQNPSRVYENKISQQLLKNKKRVSTGEQVEGRPDFKNQQKVGKRDVTETEFLDYFAKQAKNDSNSNRLISLKSRSPEFKAHKKTTERIQISQKDGISQKRSNSRKPSRVDSDGLKKLMGQVRVGSVSNKNQSENSIIGNLKTKKKIDSSQKNLANNLKHLNLILKAHCNDKILDNSKNLDGMIRSEQFAEREISAKNSKLESQTKKFRIKSSKDRMQVLLNAKTAIEPGNKSDLVARYIFTQKNKTKRKSEESECKNSQLRNVMSNAVILLPKKSNDHPKFPTIDFLHKKTMTESCKVNSSKIDQQNGKRNKLTECEKTNEGNLENSSKFAGINSVKRPETANNRVLPTGLCGSNDRSVRATRRDKSEYLIEGPITAKFIEKRASSAGLDKKKYEFQLKKGRMLSTNANLNARKNLGKFILKKKPESLENIKHLANTEIKPNNRINQISQQLIQIGNLTEFVQKGNPKNGKMTSSELVKSHLLKKKGSNKV